MSNNEIFNLVKKTTLLSADDDAPLIFTEEMQKLQFVLSEMLVTCTAFECTCEIKSKVVKSAY